ncbi:uncharacterized protein LOC124192282 [Daphnia pulex]|uniref:uncharacterized protein LOC124192282 n=1 Tax=Daphnia pulex TaxID=6669 RepID=UPI001EDDC535|nr:uncharacterized protein LOC124192282 [Daphnia pulex]
MAVNRWLSKAGWNVHQVARVSSGTHFGHFVPRHSRNGLLVVTFLAMKIKRNQFAKSFISHLELPVHCRNGVPRVSRCLFLGVRAYFSSHATVKSITNASLKLLGLPCCSQMVKGVTKTD